MLQNRWRLWLRPRPRSGSLQPYPRLPICYGLGWRFGNNFLGGKYVPLARDRCPLLFWGWLRAWSNSWFVCMRFSLINTVIIASPLIQLWLVVLHLFSFIWYFIWYFQNSNKFIQWLCRWVVFTWFKSTRMRKNRFSIFRWYAIIIMSQWWHWKISVDIKYQIWSKIS